MTQIDTVAPAAPAAPSAPGLRYWRLLSVAGSDSGGGAGVQADLKTFSALGCYGMTAISALTAQNTQGVVAVHAVPPDHLAAEIDAVVSDIGVDAVKTGMLATPEAVRVVCAAADRYRWPWLVVDPVMVSTSGSRLMGGDTVAVTVRELFPRATLITPNLDEAAWLLGRPIYSVDDLSSAAQDLVALGARAVLLKGGHLPGDEVVDVLLTREGLCQRWAGPRIVSANTHGTGCTLSSAIAAHLAQGYDLVESVTRARDFVRQALAAGAGVQLGHGHGPLNHGFAPVPLLTHS